MAAKNLLDVRTVLRDRIHEATEGYWLDLELDRAINRAKDDAWREVFNINQDYFLKVMSPALATIVDQFKYDLPEDFMRLKTIRATSGGHEHIFFRPIDRANGDFQEALRPDLVIFQPNEFMFDIHSDPAVSADPKSVLTLAPIPRQVITTILEYHAIVPDLVDDADRFGLLDPFIGFIEDRATMYALMKGPAGDFKSWGQIAAQKMEKVRNSAAQRQSKGPTFAQGFLEDDF